MKKIPEEIIKYMKPCPFCGGKDLEYDGGIHFWIICNNNHCGIGGPSSETEEGAIMKWNNRINE